MDAERVLEEDPDATKALAREPPAVEQDEMSRHIRAGCFVNERAPAMLEWLRNLRQSSSWVRGSVYHAAIIRRGSVIR